MNAPRLRRPTSTPADRTDALDTGAAEAVALASPQRSRLLRRNGILVGIALLGAVLPALISTSATPRLVGILAFALLLWTTDAMEAAVVAILVIVLLQIYHLSPPADAYAGFASDSLWLLVGVFVLSTTVEQTGLGRRLAAAFVRLGRGRPRRTAASVVGMLLALVFVVPTSSGRTAIVTPLAEGLMRRLGVQPGNRFGKVVFIAIPFVSVVSSTAVLTGAAVAVYSADYFQRTARVTLSWTDWAIAMFPVAMLCGLAVLPILWLLFRPGHVIFDDPPGDVDDEVDEEPTRLRGAQRRLGAVLLVLIVGFALSSWLDVSITVLTLTAAVIVLAPWLGVSTWRSVQNFLPWDLVMLYGGAFALATALERHRLFEPVVRTLSRPLRDVDPAVVASLVLLMMSVVRFAFSSIVTTAATVLPLMTGLAAALNLNPVWLGLIAVLGADLGLFLPTQSTAGMIAYSTGYFSIGDLAKAAVPVNIVLIVVTVLLSRFYWPLVGVPIGS